MDIFDILSRDERIIVASCIEERLIITWNQSLTLQSWIPIKSALGVDLALWEEVAIRTLHRAPKDFNEAHQFATRWLSDGVGNDR